MAFQLSQISNGVTAINSISNLLLVTPQSVKGYQPQNSPSYIKDTSTPQSPILFNYEGEQTASLESDITDHYIENNSAIQDNITLRPVTITTQGFIGELNDVAPYGLETIKQIADKLVNIGTYTPQLSLTAIIAYNTAYQAYQLTANTINNAKSTFNSITGNAQTVINGSGSVAGSVQNKQQQYFNLFYNYWLSRTLFTIQTPWAVFQDMAIKSLRAVQDADTNVITDFEISFKLMRFARTTLSNNTAFDLNNVQGRLQSYGDTQINQGASALQQSPITFSPTLVS